MSPSLAMDAMGNFVAVWTRGYADVSGRRFDSTGLTLGVEFLIAKHNSTNRHRQPSVASNSLGAFVVAWERVGASGNQDIMARRYDASGQPLGAKFRVNTVTPGVQEDPTVWVDESGGFVIVWTGPDGATATGVFGQRFDAAGERVGGEFKANSYVGWHSAPVVTGDGIGDFVVAWASFEQDGDSGSIFARRFGTQSIELLRNEEVVSLAPVTPPLATVFPLDPAPQPVGDGYIAGFVAGGHDPQVDVVADSAHPLVFYAVDTDRALRLVKNADYRLQIHF